jgi:hypothetical protein
MMSDHPELWDRVLTADDAEMLLSCGIAPHGPKRTDAEQLREAVHDPLTFMRVYDNVITRNPSSAVLLRARHRIMTGQITFPTWEWLLNGIVGA